MHRKFQRLKSIQVSVGLRLTALFAALVLALALLISYQLSNIDETARRLRLEEQADGLHQHIRFEQNGVRVDLPASQVALYESEEPQRFYAVSKPDGTIMASSQGSISARLSDGGGQFCPGLCDTVARNGPDKGFFLLTRPINVSGTPLLLTVAHRPWTSDHLMRQVESTLLVEAALLGIPICLCTYGLSLLVLRKGLAPVRALSRQADGIGPANPGARLVHPDLPHELIGLVEATNGAADRLETVVADQRRFTAEVAHQLLTPLAILSARLEEDRPTGIAPGPQHDLERMERLIHQLLSLSRATSAAETKQPVDLGYLAREVVTDFAPLSFAAGKSLAFSGPETPCVIRGMPRALREALGNLIHNAIQHSEPGDCVEVEVLPTAVITVSNPGLTIPLDILPHIFEPFFTTRTRCGGSGLGLSVVDAVAKMHNGSIVVRATSSSTDFVLVLGTQIDRSRRCP